jgi:copper chaperone CopZ
MSTTPGKFQRKTTLNERKLSMTSTTYHVTGMTCEHCARAISTELSGVDGVTDVAIDLVPGGTSLVTVVSDAHLDTEVIEAALDEAGDYRLATPGEAAGPGSVPDSRGTSVLPIVE